jgi:hypothetical protein
LEIKQANKSEQLVIMLLKSVTKTTTKSPAQIWAMYEDVGNWKSWDPSLESSELFGEFASGTKGELKPVGAPKSKFVITDHIHNEYTADRCDLIFCYISFEHRIKDLGEVREVTHSVSLNGFLAPVFKLILGKNLVEGLETAVENVCK